MPPERELRLHAVLERRQPQLLQPLHSGSRERLVREVGERRPAPQAERLAEQRGRRGIVAPARPLCLGRQALEAGEVELLVAQPQQVAGRPRLDRVRRAERAPQLRDLPLHLGHRRDRRAARIELVGEPLDRHDAVRVQQQDRERRALPRAAEPDRAVVADDLERAKEAELEHRR